MCLRCNICSHVCLHCCVLSSMFARLQSLPSPPRPSCIKCPAPLTRNLSYHEHFFVAHMKSSRSMTPSPLWNVPQIPSSISKLEKFRLPNFDVGLNIYFSIGHPRPCNYSVSKIMLAERMMRPKATPPCGNHIFGIFARRVGFFSLGRESTFISP